MNIDDLCCRRKGVKIVEETIHHVDRFEPIVANQTMTRLVSTMTTVCELYSSGPQIAHGDD